MPAAPTIVAAACSRVLEVAADAARRLAVEDVLCSHRAEHVDEVAHRLAVPLAEALLLLERLVVAERAAAHPDREPARLEVGTVDVRGRRRARPRGSRPRASRARRSGRRSRCRTRSRSSRRRDAATSKASCALVVRVRQRHRADLLDHRRRVAVRDARDLVAALGRVEVGRRARRGRGRGRRCPCGLPSSASGTRRGGPCGPGA